MNSEEAGMIKTLWASKLPGKLCKSWSPSPRDSDYRSVATSEDLLFNLT